jgi:glycosyltransferase involved in cell wall biosynthesis
MSPEEHKKLSRIPLNLKTKLELIFTHTYRGIMDYYKKLPKMLFSNFFSLREVMKKSDLIFLRIPTMNTFLTYFLIKIYKKPFITYQVGDEKEIVRNSTKYNNFSRFLAHTMASIHSALYKKIIKKAAVSFFLAPQLMELTKKKNSIFFFTSLITDQDISYHQMNADMTSPINLLYVGRISNEKGLAYLVHAVKNLIQKGLVTNLTLCGEGKEKDELERLASELDIKNNIRFTGQIPWEKIKRIYSSHDIFVLPSLSEGVPKVILESMAAGLPVIATRIGGIPNLINQNENGILIPPKSPSAIANAVENIFKNRGLREEIIQNAYKYVEHHTAEKQAHKISDIIFQRVFSKEQQCE